MQSVILSASLITLKDFCLFEVFAVSNDDNGAHIQTVYPGRHVVHEKWLNKELTETFKLSSFSPLHSWSIISYDCQIVSKSKGIGCSPPLPP